MAMSDARVFVRDGSRKEWCGNCGRHIRYHYGGTEYRCDPKPDHAKPLDRSHRDDIAAWCSQAERTPREDDPLEPAHIKFYRCYEATVRDLEQQLAEAREKLRVAVEALETIATGAEPEECPHMAMLDGYGCTDCLGSGLLGPPELLIAQGALDRIKEDGDDR
jgi:hypothetical protein